MEKLSVHVDAVKHTPTRGRRPRALKARRPRAVNVEKTKAKAKTNSDAQRFVLDGKVRILRHCIGVRGGCLTKDLKRDSRYGGQKVSLDLTLAGGKEFLGVFKSSLAWCRLLTGRPRNESPLSSQSLWKTWQEEMARKRSQGSGPFVTLSLPVAPNSKTLHRFLSIRDSAIFTMENSDANLNWLLNFIGADINVDADSNVDAADGDAGVGDGLAASGLCTPPSMTCTAAHASPPTAPAAAPSKRKRRALPPRTGDLAHVFASSRSGSSSAVSSDLPNCGDVD